MQQEKELDEPEFEIIEQQLSLSASAELSQPIYEKDRGKKRIYNLYKEIAPLNFRKGMKVRYRCGFVYGEVFKVVDVDQEKLLIKLESSKVLKTSKGARKIKPICNWHSMYNFEDGGWEEA